MQSRCRLHEMFCPEREPISPVTSADLRQRSGKQNGRDRVKTPTSMLRKVGDFTWRGMMQVQRE